MAGEGMAAEVSVGTAAPAEAPTGARRSLPGPVLSALGAVIACIGALCGVGGGLFATPVQHYLLGVPLRRAVATSLGLVCATALSSTAAEALRDDGAIPWSIVAVLVPAALVGAQLGFLAGQRMGVRWLKAVFCVALLFVAVRLALGAAHSGAVAGYAPDAADHLRVLALGLAGGFVVPLLGIGGGMVLVPGMLFCVPELGYLGARATSLAVASVTAVRSVVLHLRAGNLDPGIAAWFAAGAVLGAQVGVQLVHLDGAARVGQVLLAGILLLSSVRFGLDAARPDRRSS